MTKGEFVAQAYAAAREAGHVFPDYAACEAALASNFGQTPTGQANNLFNFRVPAKQFLPSGASTTMVPSTAHGRTGPNARLAFDTMQGCFLYRWELMKKAGMFYEAKRAKTAQDYLAQMGRLSADKQYAAKVQAIHDELIAVFTVETLP